MKNATHLENFIQVVWKYFRVFSCYFGNNLDFFSCCLEMFWKLYPVILEICTFVKKCVSQAEGWTAEQEEKEKEDTCHFAK